MTWGGFLLRYCLAALAGSALIVVLAPQVQSTPLAPRIEALLSRLERGGALAVRGVAGAVARRADDASVAGGSPRSGFADIATSVDSPAAAGREPSGDADARWALAAAPDARCYTTAGKYLSVLAPGTVLDVHDVRRNRDDLLAVCSVAGEPADSRVLVRASDLAIVPGALAKVGAEEMQLRVRHAQLKAEVDALRRQREEDVRADNPHGAAYAAAREEYRAFWRRVRDLTERRDKATGAERVAFSDELQRMRGDDARLRAAYEGAKKNYDGWNAANPPLPDRDGAALEAEMDRLRQQIEAMR